ncbi:MAG: hypothetical protein IKO33_05630 [Bacteroidaceae bacterium]|nr:hypothetical protein [Bacteroidaceae bacterium]
MNSYRHIKSAFTLRIILLGVALLSCLNSQAVIKIGGNVYGGGDQGKVNGNTTVEVLSGNLGTEDKENPGGSVFGGARMADVGGNAFVNINGEDATGYMVINRVYGGNDIAGTIEGNSDRFPDEVNPNPVGADESWNAFVHISTKTTTQGEGANAVTVAAADAQPVYIGQLFGGGNGEYDYVSEPVENSNKVTHYIYRLPRKDGDKPIAETTTDADVDITPVIAKTYVDIHGGSIVYAFAGGNNATVTEKTAIHVHNPSKVVSSIRVDASDPQTELLTTERFKAMGINTGFSYPSSDAFQIGRMFGGNNKAEMAIRPIWSLEEGLIRNLYSGGNQGAMTNKEGILIEIPENSKIVVDNLYGGCRMADVHPLLSGTLKSKVYVESEPEDIQLSDKDDQGNPLYYFPAGLSARILLKGGDVNNVYGGNDVTGRVYGGNAVGIRTSIRGSVYGGGNGSYPYTDNPALKGHDIFGDLYYDKGVNSIDSLNAFRPVAEQISLRLYGTEDNPTMIGGAVYCGGNSATIHSTETNKVELKIGSYVIADKVFMGNNGENMVKEDILQLYAGHVNNDGELLTNEGELLTGEDDGIDFSTINLKDKTQFAKYMDGVAMSLKPSIVTDSKENGDPEDYLAYKSYIGSFYLGGNVGSMTYPGTYTMDFSEPIVAYTKIVGGCNKAIVEAGPYNALYEGGILGTAAEQLDYTENGKIKDRIVLNLSEVKVEPKRIKEEDGVKTKELEWNTAVWALNGNKYGFIPVGTNDAGQSGIDPDTIDNVRRLVGGNIYGGCYESGHVNGNVVININDDLIKRDEIFADITAYDEEEDEYTINESERRSGVIMDRQVNDVNTVAMTVFGAGYGYDSEIWGSTTVNLNRGYALQIFGGGEQGFVGKKKYDNNGNPVGYSDHNYVYEYNAEYSTTVNLNGPNAGYPEGTENGKLLAEAAFLYGAGNEGNVSGNSYVYLGNGRIYDSFGGASDADVLGHTETYIGINSDGQSGFPWVRDIVYGGNDFGGTIYGSGDMKSRLTEFAQGKTYSDAALNASSYVEYLQGRVDTIFGGSYGFYDYKDPSYGHDIALPFQNSSFVNMRPVSNNNNIVSAIFGGSTGWPGNRDCDAMQNRSYVLIDIPQDQANFRNMQIFGAGSYSGLGMRYTYAQSTQVDFDKDNASAIVDLVQGEVGAAYGASYIEGVTRRTVVNVPQGSTIKIGSIFGGGYGSSYLKPCDTYDSNVNYSSNKALLVYNPTANEMLKGAIYGGNNRERRTIYAHVNINDTVYQQHPTYGKTTGNVFGAGNGRNTWAEYTEVNLNPGAVVYEVYGGGEDGKVYNAESIERYMTNYKSTIPLTAWQIGGTGYDLTDDDESVEVDEAYLYASNAPTNLANTKLVRTAEMDDRATKTYTYNTNVIIKEGATVNNYAYGGGLGEYAKVAGTTYVALLGGTVKKDIYAAGTSGAVQDTVQARNFIASANAYIRGGTARNIYGGGWRGSVGYAKYRNGQILYQDSATTVYEQIPDFIDNDGNYTDILGETHVVIGAVNGTSYTNGIPSITRNVYGGGEGGAVFGTTHLVINNGYIGYRYKNGEYAEEVDDNAGDGKLAERAGSVFGGGYVGNSYVDNTDIRMYGGTVRGSMYGGGEIAPIGRGTVSATTQGTQFAGTKTNADAKIYKAGQTYIRMYDGWVKKNVFGGGRGFDNWGTSGWMTDIEKETMDLSSKGYVFGQTNVEIHGGEIGTVSGVSQGLGNVFGGGDEGFVYSAYMQNGKLYTGHKSGERYGTDNDDEGYYYKYNGSNYVDNDGNAIGSGAKHMTEDCRVLIEPMLKVKSENGIEFDNKTYAKGEYIPIGYLNTLPRKVGNEWTSEWDVVDAGTTTKESGVIIHNAVFAGGNISYNSQINASTYTVYGNATASINDVYNRDLVTVGTGHTGGLYGDGNLTFVDGYRELNITNYGTDYYNIDQEITRALYDELYPREQAYYEIRYKCIGACTDNENTSYHPEDVTNGIKASTISHDELMVLFVKYDQSSGKYVSITEGGVPILVQDSNGDWYLNPDGDFWVENGVCSRYAGRIMNTIQRADFCGVFGSRMVMQGARDRVPETIDYTNYTINRVREVSLNKYGINGNYFGIYSVVNYLGALTSDVDFNSNDYKRVTDNSDSRYSEAIKIDGQTIGYGETGYTYYNWKKAHYKDNIRNNGNSHNKVALASGVYLELTTEKSTGIGLKEKDWGLITGVVELDLINVSTGLGGGFVYAKNQHGERTSSGKENITLSKLNKDAVSNKKYTYLDTDNSHRHEWEGSGNFVHSTQTIVDDCYNIGGRYKIGNEVPAHYWFLKGQVYVYDQYITAYTGSSNAYSETVDIPLTITAASHGKMNLVDVQKNHYAYYTVDGRTKLAKDQKIIINDVEYYLNDPISYWTWSILSAQERALFVDETYVNCVAFKIEGQDKVWEAGTYVMNQNEFDDFTDSDDDYTYLDANGKPLLDGNKQPAGTDYVFRSSNNVSHDRGYILTFDVNNPELWDKWYTPTTGTSLTTKLSTADYAALTSGKDDYNNGPTYTPKVNGLYGQRLYKYGEIIDEEVLTTYNTAYSKLSDEQKDALPTQAEFEEAYIATELIETSNQILQEGAKLIESEYSDDEWNSTLAGKVKPAYVCTNTVKIGSDYIFMHDLISETELNTLKTDIEDEIEACTSPADDNKKAALQLTLSEIENNIVRAYYCKSTNGGYYGGDYYSTGTNYRGMQAWSNMSSADRSKFNYNYDALDLLIDSLYSGNKEQKYQYDGLGYTSSQDAGQNPAQYSLPQAPGYTATYTGSYTNSSGNTVTNNSFQYTYKSGTTIKTRTISKDDELEPMAFDSIPNEQRHYSRFSVSSANQEEDKYVVYLVNTTFIYRDAPYAAGQTISGEEFSKLSQTEKQYVTIVEFDEINSTPDNNVYYFCRDPYKVGWYGDNLEYGDGEYHSVTSALATTGIAANTTKTKGQEVPTGFIISKDDYMGLNNKQLGFEIHGVMPLEYSTLYVSRHSDINDLSKEKIITAIYRYDYEESNESGTSITAVSERHVVNIHLSFQSGIPSVGDIKAPSTVLPGTGVVLEGPKVTPGAYELIGSGWELFENESYADNHTNGIEYTPALDPVYWYQDGYYIAYYAKTYLGKTYSNAVPVSVANYHDLKKVMDDKSHHLFVDYNYRKLKRDSKIYINDYSSSAQNGLDLFKDFYDLSLINTTNASSLGITFDQETGLINSTGRFKDHALLKDNAKAGNHLEFILRTNIDHSGSTWTSIASGENDPCFNGRLHGDGYTISGLTSSLFDRLCGEVYNLGVTGSFSGAGIAERGSGYIENSWISTTGTPDGSKYAVFGNPTDEADNRKQLVNSYYPEGLNYKTVEPTNDADKRGIARPMPVKSFYNGEVAYNLNGFYLNRRYFDGTNLSTGHSTYYIDPTISQNDGLKTIWNPTTPDPKFGDVGYVEERYMDGDYRYAEGSVPAWADTRERIITTSNNADSTIFAPIWPDDYLIFGQNLTYGFDAWSLHDSVPSSYNGNNRVLRAPAYYGDKVMSTIHFNVDANLAAKSSDKKHAAYPGLTAIDLAGHNDVSGGYKQGIESATSTAGEKFYAPLLDDIGLTSIANRDETRNLLVYAPSEQANSKTLSTLIGYFVEPVYNSHYTNDIYRTVSKVDEIDADDVHGHLVYSTLKAANDHLLIDKQDFNAPISYTFIEGNDGNRMWYQRTPDLYMESRNGGWETVSLPFEAELVTTQDKGEITHFYDGENVGHEYWLRTFDKVNQETDPNDNTKTIYTGMFKSLDRASSGDKTVSNTFLWDYYYSKNNQDDANGDDYQTYYNNGNRKYSKYPYYAAGTPYLVGWPGSRYYEFDLSGQFIPNNTAPTTPAQLEAQVITFASETGISIDVTDNEYARAIADATNSGYAFVPTYQTTVESHAYMMNVEGTKFQQTASATTVPFRPYFKAASGNSGGAQRRAGTRASELIIGYNGDSDQLEETMVSHSLRIYTENMSICIESTLEYPADVTIYTVAGKLLKQFTIQPATKVTVPVNNRGVYVVNHRKIAVTK